MSTPTLKLMLVDDEFIAEDSSITRPKKLGCTENGDLVIVYTDPNGRAITSLYNDPPFHDIMVIEWVDSF